jgi:PadR family transcriptional regulator PadR
MPKPDSLQGSLDLLVLKILSSRPGMHGYALMTAIHAASRDVLRVEEGSLYPALHRMEEAGWLSSTWGESENNRRAKFYSLTKVGRRQFKEETGQWARISAAMASALEAP